MVQLQNLFLLIIFTVVLCGTAAPVLFQWFLSRDVSTGAPFYNGTIIPIFTSLLPVLVHIHSKGFIHSMDGAKRIVLVKVRPILLPNIIEKDSSGTRAKNAFFLFLFLSYFIILKFMGDLPYIESFCGVLCFSSLCTLFLSSNHRRNRLANRKRRKRAQKGKCQMLWPNDRKQRRNEDRNAEGLENAKQRFLCLALFLGVLWRTRKRVLHLQPLFVSPTNGEEQNNIFARRLEGSKARRAENAKQHWMRRKLVFFSEPENRRRKSASRYTLNAFSSLLASPQAYSSIVPENKALDALLVTPYGCNQEESAKRFDWSIFFLVRALPSKLMAVGHDFRKAPPMNMKISHGGVCVFIMGVILSNTKKIQFTQLLPLGSELYIGKERCCLRGLDQLHGPTFHSICGNLIIYEPSLTNAGGDLLQEVREILPFGGEFIPDPRDPFPLPLLGDPFMFKHDGSLRATIDLLPIHFSASYGNGRLNHFFHGEESWINRGHNSCCFPFRWTMFPEKRFSFSNQGTSTTKVAIHTNLFTDLYALMGTGSFETGWYTTIMKLPFIFCIWIGFLLASLGGLRSFLRQLAFDGLNWN